MGATSASFRRAEARLALCLAFAVPLAGCGSCEPERAPPTREAPQSPASPRTVAGAARGREIPLPCRAIAVDGNVQLDTADGGAILARQNEIEPGWVWLSSDARLVAKDPRTTRETTFRGAGHVKPCVELGEESWLTSGTFESAVGAGETAGAEEWVVTPVGVVRYGTAKVRVEVPIRPLHDTVRLLVAEGVAFVWLAPDASAQEPDAGLTDSAVDEGWARISGARATLTVPSPLALPESAHAALESCRAMGRSARDLATALVGPDASGTTAAAQVRARRLARAACAVAAIRVDTLPESVRKETLVTSLTEAERLWRSAPRLR
jgi:hypothetical protein